MKTSPEISGIFTALVTPFSSDGSIDWQSFDRLIDFQARAGIDGIVISGTTGESPTLSVDEKISLFRRARASLPSSIKVMAGTGGNCTKQTVELSKLAQDAGVDSLLIVTPPYNKPSKSGLFAHFSAINDAITIPICLYHVPGRTGQTLSAEDISSLCELSRISAVKEASGDLYLFAKSLKKSKASFLSGDDFTFLPSLSVGGIGVISVLTNIFPNAFVKMHQQFCDAKLNSALEIHQTILPLIEQLFAESSPGPTKFLLAEAGLIKNNLRLPMTATSEAACKKILSIYTETKESLLNIGVL